MKETATQQLVVQRALYEMLRGQYIDPKCLVGATQLDCVPELCERALPVHEEDCCSIASDKPTRGSMGWAAGDLWVNRS